ncbi:adenylosuccinate synthetase [Streptomyces neyagawaensis]|uniref:adenylosuccinate synthetase n=1 Tax=Streptomyces neyagawaensis TaxID=42238 RepID=UPI0006E13FBF|nr:adenylosuccinate synthetase [Streptomyces neyagawaensis]MCL6739228.1 adenylosuccinate synthetase [Streptomyces neyagawaensis]MDE1688824.1 adenylosuccinate synthetase [Streptomyces neyagawaensis]
MSCTVIVGGQWGDEAKGKVAAYLALTEQPGVAVRAGLGPGAGHTVVLDGRTVKLRQVPSAVVSPGTRLLLGAGVLIRPQVLLEEIDTLKVHERVGVDYRATVIQPNHIERERADQVLTTTVRSTGSGHGPAQADRAMRSAVQAKDIPELRPYLVDVAAEVNAAVDEGTGVHVEGTNGFGLSVLYGTYPHTVAKDSTAATACADVGLGPLAVDDVVLVFRAFPTRVGGGPFPTEISPEEAQRMGIVEFGTVTGRPRRVGRFDPEQAREALRINRPSRVALTFLDYVDPDSRGLREELLPAPAAEFIAHVENELGRQIDLIGTGPDTHDMIDRRGRGPAQIGSRP